MYDICANFLKGTIAETEDSLSREDILNMKFKNLLADNLSCKEELYSGCITCPADFSYSTPTDYRNIVEARCKGLLGHHFCEVTSEGEKLYQNDFVIVKCANDDSEEIALVLETGEIVREKRKRLGLFEEQLPRVLRKANEEDIVQFEKNCGEEIRARGVFKELNEKYDLQMKLVDIHFQFDKKKLYFFYTANGRVDFRQLAKSLAGVFRTRIELRQIGVRDEAKRVGGIGTCGREFCCATHLSSFKRITSQIAQDAHNNSNSTKLSGPCGKLKCCLSYEMY